MKNTWNMNQQISAVNSKLRTEKMPLTILKTKIQKVSFSIIVITILFFVLLADKQFTTSIFLAVIDIILIIIWYRMLGEELFIYQLKANRNSTHFKRLFGDLPEKKGWTVINRLVKKGIVKEMNQQIILIDKNRVTALETKYGKCNFPE